jgi:hypothetical protein
VLREAAFCHNCCRDIKRLFENAFSDQFSLLFEVRRQEFRQKRQVMGADLKTKVGRGCIEMSRRFVSTISAAIVVVELPFLSVKAV